MTAIRTLCVSVSFFAMTLAGGAMAQTQSTPSAPAASMPMAGATMPHDCAKPMAKHDHGAEKGMPRPMSISGPCTSGAAATAAGTAASTATAKKLPKHNHSAEKNK